MQADKTAHRNFHTRDKSTLDLRNTGVRLNPGIHTAVASSATFGILPQLGGVDFRRKRRVGAIAMDDKL